MSLIQFPSSPERRVSLESMPVNCISAKRYKQEMKPIQLWCNVYKRVFLFCGQTQDFLHPDLECEQPAHSDTVHGRQKEQTNKLQAFKSAAVAGGLQHQSSGTRRCGEQIISSASLHMCLQRLFGTIFFLTFCCTFPRLYFLWVDESIKSALNLRCFQWEMSVARLIWPWGCLRCLLSFFGCFCLTLQFLLSSCSVGS